MFLYQGGYLHKEKENGLTATSLLEIRTPEWSSVSTSRFRERTFVLSVIHSSEKNNVHNKIKI